MQPAITPASPWHVVQDYLQHSKTYVCQCRFKAVSLQGLKWVLNGLSGTLAERQAIAYGRLLARKLVKRDEQIDEFAQVQEEIRQLQAKIAVTDASELTQLRQYGTELQEMTSRATAYFQG